ncbi:MAG: hypothetical protein ACW98K_02895 [Candidatus Kariarchaeaceae archaeon]|jgi:hypothetical protein
MGEQPLKFQSDLIEEAERNFSILQVSEKQERITIEIAKVLRMYLGLSLEVLQGMINKTLIEWQEENYKPMEYFETATPADRIPVVEKLFEVLNKKYLSSMIDKNVNQMTLDSAIDNAFIFYQERHAYR